MLRRGLHVLLPLVLVMAGGGLVGAGTADASATRSRVAGCQGLSRADVRGNKPTYTRKKLATFANHRRMCHGVWLPRPRRDLVPQGLAVSGRTVWVSGFGYRPGYGQRPCQLVKLDLVTGARLAFHSAVYGRVGNRPRTYCRHGGGIVQQGRWIWMVEKNKLWLVDPAQRGGVLNARRVWRIHAPVRGSAVVVRHNQLGLVPYQKSGSPRIYWFSLKRLVRRGVLDLAPTHRGIRQLGPSSSTRVPRYVQGATTDASGRLYLTRSHLRCGELVTPYGRRVGFVPGAEGIQFASQGRRLWAVSESGARPYARSRMPLTPAVASFEWPRLFRSATATCRFPAY